MKWFWVSLFLSGSVLIQAQTVKEQVNTHRFYFYWGWNRANYTKSDIHFWGKDYDFTLKDVQAKDRQSPFGVDPYFFIKKLTIPQTNMRIGFYINEKYHISLGDDHMKYVMVQDQTVQIRGTINNGTSFSGIYGFDSQIQLTGDFLKFEHTDGLNYENVELNRSDHLNDLFHIPWKWLDVYSTAGIGIGILYPRSNVTLMNKARHDEFHLSGSGLSVKTGLDIRLWKYFMILVNVKAGMIDMPHIRTTYDPTDHASQYFYFLQRNIAFGFNWGIGK